MDKYHDHSDFQYCEVDTDSAYIAIAGPLVESSVKPEMKVQQDKCNWFPRKQGLWQVNNRPRWSGKGIIELSSKTYYSLVTTVKFSCEVGNKKTNDINKEKQLNTLLTKTK